jgi:hypothetical protein
MVTEGESSHNNDVRKIYIKLDSTQPIGFINISNLLNEEVNLGTKKYL